MRKSLIRNLIITIVMIAAPLPSLAQKKHKSDKNRETSLSLPQGTVEGRVEGSPTGTILRGDVKVEESIRPVVAIRSIVIPMYTYNPAGYGMLGGFDQGTANDSLRSMLMASLEKAGYDGMDPNCVQATNNSVNSAITARFNGGFVDRSQSQTNAPSNNPCGNARADYFLDLAVQNVSSGASQKSYWSQVLSIWGVSRDEMVAGGTYRVSVTMYDARTGRNAQGRSASTVISVAMFRGKQQGNQFGMYGIVSWAQGSTASRVDYTANPAVEATTQALPYLFGAAR